MIIDRTKTNNMSRSAQTCLSFVVAKGDLSPTRLIETSLPDALADGEILVSVSRFAFTANNITYAMLGDALNYWSLFPAPEGFGNIPVWGLGVVIESRHSDVAAGETLFGYFPMATHLVIQATDVRKKALRDGAAHRQKAAAVYNSYARVTDQPAFEGRQGDYQALLRPLFMLSFLVDDFLASHEFFGARRAVLSSASSKTAFGLAHLIQTARKPVEVMGLTSRTNESFVRSLGCYDQVVTYDEIEKITPDVPTVFVDMAGNTRVRERLHRHLGEQLRYSGRIGLTHHDQHAMDIDSDLPGAKPEWFFAPDQVKRRAQDWGPGGLEQRLGAAWDGLVPNLERWLDIRHGSGPDAVRSVYLATLAGRVPPREGHMLSLGG
jgi:hypothetical protein